MENLNDKIVMPKSTFNRVPSIIFKAALFIFVLSIGYFFFGATLSHSFESFLLKQLQSKSSTTYESLAPITSQGSQYYISAINVSLKNETKTDSGSSGYGIVTTDPRILAMRKFLIDYQSPMYKSAETFIIEADKTGLDWRLVASISGVESAFGRLIPAGSYNGWGWKGDPTQEWSHFGTWDNGITVVTEGLARGYGTDLTPFEIEPVYCPPCGQNPQHAWANGVTRYMNELNFYLSEASN